MQNFIYLEIKSKNSLGINSLIFKTSFLIKKQKKRNTSANSVYLVRAWLTPNAHPYFAPQNIRYTQTLGEIIKPPFLFQVVFNF